MQVGHGVESHGMQFVKQLLQPYDSFMLSLQVSTHEVDIGRHLSEKRTHKLPAQHREVHLRMLAGTGIDHGDGHRHVTKG